MNTSLIKPALLALCIAAGSAHAASLAISFSDNCEGGGTRSASGSYDATTGAIDVTITSIACIGRPPRPAGDHPAPPAGAPAHDGQPPAGGLGIPTANGTESIKGIFLENSGSYTLDLVETSNMTVSFASGSSSVRSCTLSRKGSLDGKTNLFTGSVVRSNCSTSGTYPERAGMIEQVLLRATSGK